MALQTLTNKAGIIMSTVGEVGRLATSSTTIDAVGESFAGIGKVFLEAGSGSKTISSGGGKIYFRTAGVTFANAGTTLRVGIQDVATTGFEDGTFDVYKDMVGGTDTINANAVNIVSMASGSKTINHGDIIAVCLEMTARAGADTVAVTRASTNTLVGPSFPYCTADTGSLAKSSNQLPAILLEFDDGTIGWFQPSYYLPGNWGTSPSTIDYAQNSTPDEYAAVFQVPFKCAITGAALQLGQASSGRTFEIVLYSDAEGTPTVVETITPDEDLMSATTGMFWVPFTSYTLSINSWYAVSMRPTTNNTSRITYLDLGSGNNKMKRPSDFGSNIKFSSRTNQTGAFSEVQNYYMPLFMLEVEKLDDGASAGGLKTHPGMAGGMRG